MAPWRGSNPVSWSHEPGMTYWVI